ncbi:hypothetical protein MMC07_004492 [Pseudocyphellaria aurata]|nr:hypothetical protein [Pseudocyphellaria aurata]
MAASSSTRDDAVLDTYHAVVLAFSDFLTVSIHTILYERDIYPQGSFIKARKYNFPVRQCRHPKVCQWIQDAVAAVEVEMLKCTLHSTSLVICSPPPSSTPLERYTFCTAAFPQIQPSEHLIPFSPSVNASAGGTANPPIDAAALLPLPKPPPPTQNLPSQFRATLSRLSVILPTLAPVPPDCTFTVAIELRETADVPIGVSVHNVQPWIVAQPGMQKEQQRARRRQAAARGQGGEEEGPAAEEEEEADGRRGGLGSVRTTPVRSLDAGAFVMEMWVEEGKAKLALPQQQKKQDSSEAAPTSFSDPGPSSSPSVSKPSSSFSG